MKTNPNDIAFPSAGAQNYEESSLVGGLTKLEYFAASALQGILSKPLLYITTGNESLEILRKQQARDAILSAKALIDELNKQDEEIK